MSFNALPETKFNVFYLLNDPSPSWCCLQEIVERVNKDFVLEIKEKSGYWLTDVVHVYDVM